MTREELAGLSQEDLISLVLRLHEQLTSLLSSAQEVAVLLERVAQLEAELAEREPPKGKPRWAKSNKAETAGEKPARKKRPHGFGRKREQPTHRVQHAAENCPKCGCKLRGGWVKRRRQVLNIPLPPVEVIEHEIIVRQCPQCGEEVVPKVELSDQVLGQHRVSIQTMVLIAMLREIGRLPLKTIQWILSQFYGLKLCRGELTEILHTVGKQAEASLERLKEQVRASPVVHADETGWRENGRNGYIWTFSTPQIRYFLYRHSRSGKVVTEVLGNDFLGHLVSDFYAGYNRMMGQHQRCWVHLLRDIHKLKEDHPEDAELQRWARRVYRLYCWAKTFQSDDRATRERAQHLFERLLSNLSQPFLKSKAPQRTLCERIERYLPELFPFVADPRVPADNNAAERSLRPLVVSRKISGGTRSEAGSDTKMTLASIVGTWLAQDINPFEACRNLLTSREV